MMPLVTQQDAEKVLTDYLYDLLPTLPQTQGWSVGTVVEPGRTPVNAVRVRSVGGVPVNRVVDSPRLDVRVWTDGSYLTEGQAKQTARVILAHIRRDFRATVVANPVALPDPANNTRTHVLFTVELLLRGDQT